MVDTQRVGSKAKVLASGMDGCSEQVKHWSLSSWTEDTFSLPSILPPSDYNPLPKRRVPVPPSSISSNIHRISECSFQISIAKGSTGAGPHSDWNGERRSDSSGFSTNRPMVLHGSSGCGTSTSSYSTDRSEEKIRFGQPERTEDGIIAATKINEGNELCFHRLCRWLVMFFHRRLTIDSLRTDDEG